MAMARRTVSVAICVTDSAVWPGGLTSYERMFVVFAILSCVSSQAQHNGRQYIDEQTTSPRQERTR
jgi:hypothetical protein